jgi:hypothetical protein
MKKLFFIAFIGLIAYGCSNSSNTPAVSDSQNEVSEKQAIFENDLENALAGIPSWSNEKTIVKMPEGMKAHSGEFVTMIDNSNKYSYAFKDIFENINEKLPVTVIVSGWFYSTDKNPKMSIVMDINDNNNTFIWKGYQLMKDPKPLNQWNEFKATFSIDQPIKPSNQIKIFAFDANATAYFDDLKVTFEY